MPPSWKDKGARLQAFARGSLDSGVNSNAAAPKPETAAKGRPETPQDASHAPTRQELANAARLDLPSGLPNGAASRQQNGRLRSPPRLTQTSPTPRRGRRESEDGRNQLFSGSQLGEGFMKSGPSTPQNEAADSEDEATPNARRTSGRVFQKHVRDVGRGLPNGGGPAFRLEDNGMMTVVAEKARRAPPPLMMMDGFRDEALSADKRHVSNYVTTTLQPKPQLREVRVKRLPAPGHSVHFPNGEVGSPSPAAEIARWQTQSKREEQPQQAMAVSDSEEEMEPVGGYGESRTCRSNKAGDGARRRMGGTSTPANIALQKLPRDRKRRRGSPDYDDRILSSMTYKDLLDEPFDLDPSTATGPSGHDGSAKLPLKLEQYRQQGDKEQAHMFATMSFDDWEASGDWFSEQFASIMKRLKEARRSKRRTMRAFEDEAARREEAVRLRSETIERKLAKMRQDGQRVVEDKSL